MKKIIILSLMLAFVIAGCSLTANNNTQEEISIEEAKTMILAFINENLMAPGSQAMVKEVNEEFGLYKVVVDVSGQEVDSYLTKDGKKFFPQVIDIEEITKQNEVDNTQAQAETTVPKVAKAKAELFAMSFCPYGVIAENVMAPVFELLGEVADIEVHYIASINGDDINQVKSLHGPIEGIEDARQLCVLKNYGQEVFWNYVNEINEKCYPIYRNGDDVYKTCWQTAARTAGANVAKLDSCVDTEGASLIQAEDKLAQGYGVSGSPTLIINGVKATAARTPEGYKTAICNGFENPPEECNTKLSEEGGVADGNCN